MNLKERRVECEMGLERTIVVDVAEGMLGYPEDGCYCNEIEFLSGRLSKTSKQQEEKRPKYVVTS